MEMNLIGYLILGVIVSLLGFGVFSLSQWAGRSAFVEKYAAYVDFALVAVEAAEQMYDLETGEQKLNFALSVFMDRFPETDEMFARSLIESAVFQLNQLLDLVQEG